MTQPTIAPPSRQLDRVLGPWMATALVIGTVIGSGVFKKPRDVASDVPVFGLALGAWILVGVLTLMGALALAEVAVLLPRAGGNYVFLREAYGRWAGFLWGWVEFWIIRSASIAALATIFTDSLFSIFDQLDWLPTGPAPWVDWARVGATVGVIAVLALVNARGTLLGGGLQVVVTSVKVASLVTIALLPLVFLALALPAAESVSFDNLAPVWPTDWTAVNWSKFGGALVAVLWAYHGWMNLAPVAEEVREPRRNIPLALLVGTMAVMILYVSVNFAYHLVVSQAEMRALPRGSVVAVEFTARLLGSIGAVLVSAAIMTSVFGSLNGNLLVGPRLLFAMGRDGLAPRWLARLHPTWRTPATAELFLAGWSISLVVGVALLLRYHVLPEGTDAFDVLTNYAIFGATSFETLAVAAIFVLRSRHVAGPDAAYRCPLFPWLPLLYVVAMAAVLVNMFFAKTTESLIAVAFIACGAGLYAMVLAGRKPSADTPS